MALYHNSRKNVNTAGGEFLAAKEFPSRTHPKKVILGISYIF